MSDSYRRPYASITGSKSARDDKRRAARGVRRKQNQWLRTCIDFEDAIVPHKLECAWNNTYSWNRDGGKWLHFKPDVDSACIQGEFDQEWYDERYEYWLRLHRK